MGSGHRLTYLIESLSSGQKKGAFNINLAKEAATSLLFLEFISQSGHESTILSQRAFGFIPPQPIYRPSRTNFLQNRAVSQEFLDTHQGITDLD